MVEPRRGPWSGLPNPAPFARALPRRRFILGSVVGMAAVAIGCGGDDGAPGQSSEANPPNGGRYHMPSEEHTHAATWMCWPSTEDVWGDALPRVQETIAAIALTIARFEPVKMLARPSQVQGVKKGLAGANVEVIEAPVDDLWARDTLPVFLIANSPAGPAPLAAGRVRFNGWGGKQVHAGDATLAQLVANGLQIPLIDSGLSGEGGGLEVDGAGTILAARSSWVNDNRNRGLTETEIARRLADLLGAQRLIWVDGLAGADITDGHIDTLARFASPGVVVLDQPAVREPGEKWYDVSVATKRALAAAQDARAGTFRFTTLVQPASPRGRGDGFLSSYVNYYVCNGAVIAPSFGDGPADRAATAVLGGLYPGRIVVQVDIDPLAAGGGGIHCATQQEPIVAAS